MIPQPLLKFVPIVFVVLWSTGFIGAKYSMPYAEPFTLLAIRMAIAATLLLLTTLVIKTRWPDARGALHSLVVGALIHALYLGGVFAAIKQGMPAGIASLIVGLQPILTAVLAWFWLSERLVARQIIGLILGLAGVAMVLAFRQSSQLSLEFGSAELIFTLFAVASISVGTLYQKRFCGQVSLLAGTFYQYAGATVILTVMAFIFETRVVEWNLQLVLALAWLVVVLSLAAVLLLMLMIREGQASTIASYFYLTPPVTAIIAWLLFDERLGIFAIAGILVASTGVYLARTRKLS
ncbi:MAG: DMT family transporter [Gammaproteobacteria bacterium]|nr:DMT family transporter [Gammaproteobacteria bacterium]